MSREIAKAEPVQISVDAFAVGMAQLRVMFQLGAAREPEEQAVQTEVFYQVLGQRMRDPEWLRVVAHVLESRGRTAGDPRDPRTFPVAGELLRAMDELREAERDDPGGDE